MYTQASYIQTRATIADCMPYTEITGKQRLQITQRDDSVKMNIGENIRELRKKRGITREQLAEITGISFQAVSKWETGESLPDITMVPVLAAYFGVTTDALLSFDRSEMERDIGRIVDEAFACREAEPVKSREILEAGLVKYPDNDVLRNNVLYTMNYTADPEATIAYASRLIADTDDSEIMYNALRFLAYAYSAMGDRKSAVAALEQVPELYFTRLSEMAFVAEGQAKYEAAEKQLWISLETMIQMLWKLAECCEEEGDVDGAMRRARQALAIIEALKDERKIVNFQIYVDYLNGQIDRLNN